MAHPRSCRALTEHAHEPTLGRSAVMAFETLALVHPFIGQKVLDPDEDEGGWDAEPVAEGAPADLDEQAYAGYLPFVDDENDDSNRALSGLPRGLVLTPQLAKLFQETFGAGRTKPWRRPAMAFWALELTRAHDLSLACPTCSMSYLAETTRTARTVARPGRPSRLPPLTAGRWSSSRTVTEVRLPIACSIPFSLELNGHDGVRSGTRLRAAVQRPTCAALNNCLPSLSFEFVEEVE